MSISGRLEPHWCTFGILNSTTCPRNSSTCPGVVCTLYRCIHRERQQWCTWQTVLALGAFPQDIARLRLLKVLVYLQRDPNIKTKFDSKNRTQPRAEKQDRREDHTLFLGVRCPKNRNKNIPSMLVPSSVAYAVDFS